LARQGDGVEYISQGDGVEYIRIWGTPSRRLVFWDDAPSLYNRRDRVKL